MRAEEEKSVNFSERMGLVEPRLLQVDEMDDRLRISVFNALADLVESKWGFTLAGHYEFESGFGKSLALEIWRVCWCVPIDEFPSNHGGQQARRFMEKAKNRILQGKWEDVYTLVEFIIQKKEYERFVKPFELELNAVFERERSGYRIVAGQVAPIISEMEIVVIDEASQLPEAYAGAESHIKKAVGLVSDRENPDYSNSIKEAISAVESCGKVYVDGKKATLGDVLNEMRKKREIHPQLLEAWNNLYAYTNAVPGVRHGKKESEQYVGFDEAKYMLVTCSAIVNYLCSKGVGKNSG